MIGYVKQGRWKTHTSYVLYNIYRHGHGRSRAGGDLSDNTRTVVSLVYSTLHITAIATVSKCSPTTSCPCTIYYIVQWHYEIICTIIHMAEHNNMMMINKTP